MIPHPPGGWDLVNVTPSDTVPNRLVGIRNWSSGNLRVETEGGSTVTFVLPATGGTVWLSIVKVLFSGTSAVGLIGMRP